MNWTGALEDAWGTVVNFVPRLIAFLLILLIGWLVARAVAALVNRVLERVGFDRAVERGGIRAALENSRYDASDIIAKIVFYAILLFTLQLAFSVFGPNAVSDLLTRIVAFLPKIFVAIVIVVVAAAIANAVRDLLRGVLGGTSLGRVLSTGAWVLILALGVIAALNQVDIATTVTTPILIAFLATIAGVIIVGAGGGLVRPMQHRWDRWLDQADREISQARTSNDVTGNGRHSTPATTPASRPAGAPGTSEMPAYPPQGQTGHDQGDAYR